MLSVEFRIEACERRSRVGVAKAAGLRYLGGGICELLMLSR